MFPALPKAKDSPYSPCCCHISTVLDNHHRWLSHADITAIGVTSSPPSSNPSRCSQGAPQITQRPPSSTLLLPPRLLLSTLLCRYHHHHNCLCRRPYSVSSCRCQEHCSPRCQQQSPHTIPHMNYSHVSFSLSKNLKVEEEADSKLLSDKDEYVQQHTGSTYVPACP